MRANIAMKQAAEHCPLCGADLQGPPIPEQDRQYYGGATHFSRKVGIVGHDRIDRWQCPDCKGEWG